MERSFFVMLTQGLQDQGDAVYVTGVTEGRAFAGSEGG